MRTSHRLNRGTQLSAPEEMALKRNMVDIQSRGMTCLTAFELQGNGVIRNYLCEVKSFPCRCNEKETDFRRKRNVYRPADPRT